MNFSPNIAALKKLLTNKGLRLKAAESFTGGYISSLFTSVEGASQYFSEGIVCYTPESKMARLGVDKATIEKYGTVSVNCVKQMLKGLMDSNNCDIALATSGNASDSIEPSTVKGDCYIGVACSNQTRIFYHKFSGSRKNIVAQGTQAALEHLLQLINLTH